MRIGMMMGFNDSIETITAPYADFFELIGRASAQ